MEQPACLPYEAIAAERGVRPVPRVFDSLWCAGSPQGLRLPVVAIVGTRAATGHGKGLAHRFAAELAAAGCCILSGLALGIDAAAHRGALEGGAPTIGVLGGGHEAFFPRRNRALAEEMIAAGGAVLSPFPPAHPAFPAQFLQRNGVVAALADAVVVIEAPARSGALNTAGWAAGRIPVFAVPGDVDRPHVAGCHALIRDGATLARSAQDVLDDLRLGVEIRSDPQQPLPLPDDLAQREILSLLGAGERVLDEIFACSAYDAPLILAALGMLEAAGRIESRPGGRYALT